MARTAVRSACGWLSLSARRAAFSCCPDAAALDSACCAPACAASPFASSSAAAAVASSQSVNLASAPPVAIRTPSPSHASAHALSSCASSVAMAAPTRTPQSTRRPSPPLLTICVPALMKHSDSTAPVWPSNVRRHAFPLPPLPLLGSHDHSLIILSPPAVAMMRSDGENATAHTPRLWPRSTPAGIRSGSRHKRAVRSPEQVAPNVRLGATAQQLTALSCATAAALAGSGTTGIRMAAAAAGSDSGLTPAAV
mmetsp:Transcript_29761/g.73742  ORF Transcript_29761/g.73742 Transcript_29761/m.73742 type:complete len:253 (-) Transcript_29761:469-1227(-)